VTQIKNDYDREVFNGDAGYVVKVDPLGNSMTVESPETDYQKIQDGVCFSYSTLALVIAG
jgi:ATP-dependent exoDNAse (exonuclease V) alpha subunit